VLHYFDVTVTADDVAFPKPDPQCITIILNELDCPKERAIMIGDTRTDILTGKNGAIKTCGVLYGFGTKAALQAVQPDYIISNIGELRKIVG
jgi:phosphoglycolate phosphatase